MKYLVDTNIWLELFLEQEKSSSVRTFLQSTNPEQLAMTDFTLYSIGIILIRLSRGNVFQDFVSDTLEKAGVAKVRLDAEDLKRLVMICKDYHLDFDDAYQYQAAEKHDLILVSFDADFDSTPRKRKSPEEIISKK